jgi:hypothetical protein
MEKACSKCKIAKPLSDFYITRGKHISKCKSCSSKDCKEMNEKFNEERKEKKRLAYHKNKEKILRIRRKNYEANKEHFLEINRKWAKDNLHTLALRNINRFRQIKKQTLKCLSDKHLLEIKAIYKKALEKTVETGTRWEVDHIIPIRGENVSGLHVPWNLQVIKMSENRSKSNKFTQA